MIKDPSGIDPESAASAPEVPSCWSLKPQVRGHGDAGQGEWESYREELSDCQEIFREQSNEYVPNDDFSAWLARWRSMLAPGGRIVVSDLIPPDYRPVSDIAHLLKFSARRGFFLRAIWQGLREVMPYWRRRRARPLSRIGRAELWQRGATAGLAVHFLPNNLTHLTRRITAIFTFPSQHLTSLTDDGPALLR